MNYCEIHGDQEGCPACEAEDVKSKWISVEDRLPEVGQNVMTFDGSRRVFCCVRQQGRFKVHYTVWDHDNVTHWMPLPEAPEV